MDDLLKYLKKPIYIDSIRPNFYNIISLAVITFLIIFPTGIVIYLLSIAFDLSTLTNDIPALKLFIMGMILAPIYEEIFFRSLLKFDKKNILIFLSTCLLLITYSILNDKFAIIIILSIILILVISIYLSSNVNKVSNFIKKHFKYFFYASSLIFGLIHATNFIGNIYIIISLAIFLTLPQIISGLIMGYARMKYGLIYSIILHMINNSVIIFTLLKQ